MGLRGSAWANMSMAPKQPPQLTEEEMLIANMFDDQGQAQPVTPITNLLPLWEAQSRQPQVKTSKTLFNKSTADKGSEDKQTQQATFRHMLSQDEMDKLFPTLNEYPLSSSREMVQNIEDLQNLKNAISNAGINRQMDLQPLMALSDELFGGQMAKSYTPPMSKEDYIAAEAKIQDQLSKSRHALSEQDLTLMKQLLPNVQVIGTQAVQKESTGTKEGSNFNTTVIPPSQPAPAKLQKDQDALADKLLKSSEAKSIGGILSFNNALDQYLSLVRAKGIVAFGADKNSLDSAYSDLKTSFKEAKNLGALSGPDIGILIEGMKPATGALEKISAGVGISGGVEGIYNSAKVLKKNATEDFSRNYSNASKAYGGYERTDSILSDWSNRAGKVGVAPSAGKSAQDNQREKAKAARAARATGGVKP